jgi:hypothetical protein
VTGSVSTRGHEIVYGERESEKKVTRSEAAEGNIMTEDGKRGILEDIGEGGTVIIHRAGSSRKEWSEGSVWLAGTREKQEEGNREEAAATVMAVAGLILVEQKQNWPRWNGHKQRQRQRHR